MKQNRKDLTSYDYVDESFDGFTLIACIVFSLLFWLLSYSFINGNNYNDNNYIIWATITGAISFLIIIGYIYYLIINNRMNKEQRELNKKISDYYSPLIDDVKKYNISYYDNKDELSVILETISFYIKDSVKNYENDTFISIISTIFSKNVNWWKTKNLLEKLKQSDLVDIELLIKTTKKFIMENPLNNDFRFTIPYRNGHLKIELDINDFLKILESVK